MNLESWWIALHDAGQMCAHAYTHTHTHTHIHTHTHTHTQFAQENEQLLEHVTTMVDEVRQIEGRVIEISKLQELFSQKVLQQVQYTILLSRPYTCVHFDHMQVKLPPLTLTIVRVLDF